MTADLVVVDDFWLKDLSSLANLERVGAGDVRPHASIERFPAVFLARPSF